MEYQFIDIGLGKNALFSRSLHTVALQRKKAFFPATALIGRKHLPEQLAFVFRFGLGQLLEAFGKIRRERDRDWNTCVFHWAPLV